MSRREVVETVRRVGREHSDATVVFHAEIAARLGLHPTDHKTMSLLERHGAMTAGEIARRTALTTSSVTALVDRLEARGFVRRIRDPADRRRVIVEPVPEGIAEFEPYFVHPKQSLDRLFAAYTTDELRIIADFLTRSTQRLQEETARLAGATSAAKEH